MTAPTLTTARLTLRMPVLADFGPRAAFHASDRSVYEGGPCGRAEDVVIEHDLRGLA